MKVFLTLLLGIMVGPAFAASLTSTAVVIPGAQKGARFDDIRFAKDIHKLLVPAGKTGELWLIDPVTGAMTVIDGFTSSGEDKRGHHLGVSSADEGEGFIFTGDHGTRQLEAVDEKTRKVTAHAALADDPDIIRYVATAHEVWVTEPDGKNKALEIFKTPSLQKIMDIPVPDGPESLTIDNTRQRAYTNLGEQTGAIDLKSHAIISQWPSGCSMEASGTAIDEQRGFLFVACKEGKVDVFDLNQNNKQVSTAAAGPGPDLVDYNPNLAHFYITGSKDATLSVFGVSSKGELSLLGTRPAVKRGHCVTGDDQNNIWVCDPLHGQLLKYKDTYAAVQ
jgi:hypothetical protein